jgi:hypothetical protein
MLECKLCIIITAVKKRVDGGEEYDYSDINLVSSYTNL